MELAAPQKTQHQRLPKSRFAFDRFAPRRKAAKKYKVI